MVTYGGSNPRADSINIDVRNKRLSRILGFVGRWNGVTVIKSMRFQFTDGWDTQWLGSVGSKPPYFTSPVLPFEYDVPLGLGLMGVFGNTGAVHGSDRFQIRRFALLTYQRLLRGIGVRPFPT